LTGAGVSALRTARDHVGVEVRRRDGSVIGCEVVGEPGAAPVLLCHGLADSRLSARTFTQVARDLELRIVAQDRPGTGRTDPRHLSRLVDWVQDARLVLDALDIDAAALIGVSGGGPFAAACAAQLPGRVSHLTLISALGAPGWPTSGMATGERLSLEAARRVPGFGGWFLGRLAVLARTSPDLFLRVATSELPGSDRRALEQPAMREPFLANYCEAFRQGSQGVGQDLRVLTRPWGFELGSIQVPTLVCHGDADLTVPVQHARRFAAAIPGAQLQIYAGHGHFSIFDAVPDMLAPLAR
jgi:pimeloyl-ACP methyl ester carboxylesterase